MANYTGSFTLLFLASWAVIGDASNLRIMHAGDRLLANKSASDGYHHTATDAIADPSCKQGVVSPDLKVCCHASCGSCGTHALCGDVGAYHEKTGKLADNCCKERIMKKAPSCDKDHPPCVLSPDYKKQLATYTENRPSRSAIDDCNKAVSKNRASAALGVDKGEFFTKLFLESRTRYEDAKAMAIKVRGLCEAKSRQSKELVERFRAKIEDATDSDKKEDALSGISNVMKWDEKADDEGSEVEFYGMIVKNSNQVEDLADKGVIKVKDLKSDVRPVKDLDKYEVQMNALIDDAEAVYKDAEMLWQQWLDSSKDYPCSAPPSVDHTDSQCTEGNTKFSRRCAITCTPGYDSPFSRNALRCNRQGKFGKELYGEWAGMSTCIGRNCGKPPKISKAKHVNQDIRFPHSAGYICYEGFSMDRKADGPKAFEVRCDTKGNFAMEQKHVCRSILCGKAPAIKNSKNTEGDLSYTEIATYTCNKGYTVDATPGGLTEFTTSCQATGKFSAALDCKRVRCGPAPSFKSTSSENEDYLTDRFFSDKVHYKCDNGYTLDQKVGGDEEYTLECQADGEFQVPGFTSEPLPSCRPVSAGMAPTIAFGNFVPREMFFTESVTVSADDGYSISGNPGEGVTFDLVVTPEGTYSGEEKFIPVICGSPLKVAKASTTFSNSKAVYKDEMQYECVAGYSTDATAEESKTTFSVQCEVDATFSKVPDLGKCVNVDDCADITCGAFGHCVDHLQNYTCACESGYEQVKNNMSGELTCGNVDDCGPEACGVGECIDGLKDYKCKCPTGYEQVDSTDEKGKAEHTCSRVLCGLPPVVANTATSPTDLQEQKAKFEDKITYQCDIGHTTDATAKGHHGFDIDCQADKKFTDTEECKRIVCEGVPEVKFATVKKTSAKYDEKVRFDCQEGYTTDGTVSGDHGFTLTCQVNGEFGVPQECKPVTCGEPDEITNANRAGGSLVFEQKVKYECFDGFTTDGHRDSGTSWEITCEANGKFTKMEQCLPKICGKPSKINVLYASTEDEGNVVYPLNTEVVCRDGYTVGGDARGASTFNVACTAEGVFETYDERGCEPVRGGAPPLMKNATLIDIKTPNPAKQGIIRHVFFLKDKNNKIPTDLYRRGADQKDVVDSFNKGVSTAGIKEDNWAARYSASIDIDEADDYDFRMACKAGCNLFIDGDKVIDNDGQHGFGDSKSVKELSLTKGPHSVIVEMYARKGGGTGEGAGLLSLQWRKTDGDSYSDIPSSAFKTKGGNLNYGEKAVYECLVGFTTGGEYNAPTKYNVEVLPTGELSFPSDDQQCRNVNDCEQHTCGTKGLCVDKIGKAPAYDCKCDFGYEVNVAANGEKHCGNVDDCAGKDCGVGTCIDKIGDYSCSCPSGYYIGFKKDGSKTCVAVQCSADTPVLTHGKMLSTHSGAVDFPTTLRYKCDTGYSRDGSVAESSRKFQAQCKADGQLFGMMACQKVTCGSAYVLPFTKLLEPSSPRKSIEYNDKAKYECYDGYTIGGKPDAATDFEVKCQDSGILTDPEVCEPVKCGLAPYVSKSRAGISGNVYYGMHLMYRCDLGYTSDGTPGGATEFGPRTCGKDGKLSDVPANPCRPVTAGKAPKVENAYLTEYAGEAVSPNNRENTNVYYPNGLEYRCNEGYSTTGASSGATKISVRVTSIGQFSPALPQQCKLITYVIRGITKSARSGSALNSVTVTGVQCTDRAGSRCTKTHTNSATVSGSGTFLLTGFRKGEKVTLTYKRSGYIDVTKEFMDMGNVPIRSIADVSMSPVMRSDQWRAVLKWKERPSDLDSWARVNPWTWVGWTDRSAGGGYPGWPKATLEVDITSGFGPETMYFENVGNCPSSLPRHECTIQYNIVDYGRTNSMKTHGAEVTLYTGTRIAAKFDTSSCAGAVSGDQYQWRVFELDSTTNKLSWTCNGQRLFLTQADAKAATGPSTAEDSPKEKKLPLLRNPRK